MSNPLVRAFFVGRALADTLYEQAEHALTDALSELGKFDAEQRERLHQFSEQVLERARREEDAVMGGRTGKTTDVNSQPEDLQEMIDELRAEVAQLRAELKQHRSSRTP